MLALQVNAEAETIEFQKNIFQFSYIKFFGGRFYNKVQEIFHQRTVWDKTQLLQQRKLMAFFSGHPQTFSTSCVFCHVLSSSLKAQNPYHRNKHYGFGQQTKPQESRFITYLFLHRSRCPAAAQNEAQNLSKEPVLLIVTDSRGRHKQVNHSECSMDHLGIFSLCHLVLKGF